MCCLLTHFDPPAQGIDFDSWQADGWDFKSLLPLMKRLESYHIRAPGVDQHLHGHGGPINVSYGPYAREKPQNDFLAAVKAVGYHEMPDLQDFESVNGFSKWARYVDVNGQRQDAAHCYIHPLMTSGQYPNLELLVETKVSRVIFEGSHARGIECIPSKESQSLPGMTQQPPFILRARKLVIVSAGALGTPSILERSGVGNEAILRPLGIPVVSNLPGVGENYQDHHLILYPYKSSLKSDETLDELLSGELSFEAALKERSSILGWNGIDLASKLRPSEDEVKCLGREFQETWRRDFHHSPTKPLMLMAPIQAFLGDRSVLDKQDGEQFFTFGAFTAYPYSRGSIHIASPDASLPASFKTGFLSNPMDLSVHVWAYKKQREICRRTNAYAGELAMGHPNFSPNSLAAIQSGHRGHADFRSLEERMALPPIHYNAEDDAAIKDWIRSHLETTWHSLGTCKMGPRESGGVVDSRLNVYGTHGLKCIGELLMFLSWVLSVTNQPDLSIPPENVGANTNHTALLIGEKGADIIANELGLHI